MQANSIFVRLFCQIAIPTFNRHWSKLPANKSLINRTKKLSHTAKAWPFQVSVNVRNYTPKELSVKATQNTIIIEGHHEEKRDDQGFIERHFVRRYTLPDEFENGDIRANLAKDGILTVTVPVPEKTIEGSKFRTIMIDENDEVLDGGAEHIGDK